MVINFIGAFYCCDLEKNVSKTNLYLCLFDEDIQAYKSTDLQTWTVMNIKGELALTHHSDIKSISEVLKECNERLNIESNLMHVTIYVLYTPKMYIWLQEVLQQILRLGNQQVHILPWNNLVEYAQKNSVIPFVFPLSQSVIMENILPLTSLDISWHQYQNLLKSLDQQHELKKEQFEQEEQNLNIHLSEQFAQLEAEKQKLILEVQHAQQRVMALQRPDLESLLSFLPSIFKNFWNTVRPDELANIAGLIDVPKVQSPYHNPSLAAVQAKKRQFQALVDTEKAQIINFCRQLKQDYNLKIHLEFQTLIGELD